MSNPLEDAKKDVDHFYTTNPTGELAPKDYMYEGIAGYVYLTPRENRIPIYRFWNGKIVDHFYTESQAEALKVVADLKDYKLESICSYPTASHSSHPGTSPVGFRLFVATELIACVSRYACVVLP